jgi:hypothetical protein
VAPLNTGCVRRTVHPACNAPPSLARFAAPLRSSPLRVTCHPTFQPVGPPHAEPGCQPHSRSLVRRPQLNLPPGLVGRLRLLCVSRPLINLWEFLALLQQRTRTPTMSTWIFQLDGEERFRKPLQLLFWSSNDLAVFPFQEEEERDSADPALLGTGPARKVPEPREK